MDGMHDFVVAVDNKHCIKNDCYQLIGGSCIATIRNHNIDCNILLQAGVSKDLIVIKDFTSNKKV